MMPLSMVKPGIPVIIKKVVGKDKIRNHLMNLGFVEGGIVTIITELNGNLLIKVKEVRIALDKTMANRVMV
ncbi:ferrous iron transport protein A [Mycoplasmatota bacterium]|nr:ferrous iron transport protein A [Mycoplasmatota bacterium]